MTEYLISGRQSGKTTALLKRMAEDPSIIMVCCDRASAQAAHRTAEAQGLLIDRARFVTPNEAHARKPSRHWSAEPRYVVDNLELVLARMLGGSIDAVSATGYARTPPLAQEDAVAVMLKDI